MLGAYKYPDLYKIGYKCVLRAIAMLAVITIRNNAVVYESIRDNAIIVESMLKSTYKECLSS